MVFRFVQKNPGCFCAVIPEEFAKVSGIADISEQGSVTRIHGAGQTRLIAQNCPASQGEPTVRGWQTYAAELADACPDYP